MIKQKVRMTMKCKHCNGYGYTIVRTLPNPVTGNGYKSECPFCNGTGEVPDKEEQTNEIWFCSLPTTEKSDFLAKMAQNAIKVHNECGTAYHETVSWWDEWLKAPHT